MASGHKNQDQRGSNLDLINIADHPLFRETAHHYPPDTMVSRNGEIYYGDEEDFCCKK